MRNEERREKIFEKYSKLYRRKTSEDSGRWPIHYGFEFNDGWLDIVEDLSDAIQTYVDYQAKSNPSFKQPEVLQCKEKFGALRFYIVDGDDYISGLIAFAERISSRVCESCGAAGKKQPGAWIKTMCDSCYDKRNKERAGVMQQLAELQKNFHER